MESKCNRANAVASMDGDGRHIGYASTEAKEVQSGRLEGRLKNMTNGVKIMVGIAIVLSWFSYGEYQRLTKGLADTQAQVASVAKASKETLEAMTAVIDKLSKRFREVEAGQSTKEVAQPKPEPPKVVIAATRQWYLVSESWCAACPAEKKKFLALGWPAANVLTIDECQRRFGFRPLRIPFAFGDPSTMSQDEKVSLHNMLHGGRPHNWPGDLTDHLEATHRVKVR